MRTKVFWAIVGSIVAVIAAIVLMIVFIPKAPSDTQNEEGVRTINMRWTDGYDGKTIVDEGNRKMFVINGNHSSWENLYIQTDAKEVKIVNLKITNKNGGVGIKILASNAIVEMENVAIKMESNGGHAVEFSRNAKLEVHDEVILSGGNGSRGGQSGGSGIKAEDLTIVGDGELKLNGGNAANGNAGGNGYNGKSFNVNVSAASFGNNGRNGNNGGDGETGGVGQKAGQGGDGLSCAHLTVKETVRIISYGGNGAASGQGGRGGDGGDGEGAVEGRPIPINSYSGGRGGNAGQGGAGADEVRMGYGIACSQAIIADTASVSSKRGKRGTAGSAGSPGVAGVGGKSMSGVSRGGSGSSAGKGKEGKALAASALVEYYADSLIGKIN